VDTDLVKATPYKKAGWLPNILSRFSNAPTDLVNFTEKAGDVMSREVFAVQPDTPLTDVIRLMVDKQIKRLVVTDEEKRLAGMVSRESILRVMISNA
jgi:CBS domain-containing protein